MQVFFQNYLKGIHVSALHPLDAMKEQVLEIFKELPEDDGSFLGVINDDNITIQFSNYNRFVWLVDIPIITKKGSYQVFLTKKKCQDLIIGLFSGLNPLKINGLSFEKFI